MVYNDLYKFENHIDNYVLTKDEINMMDAVDGIKNDSTIIGEKVTILKVSDFDSTYKDFFHEEANYSIDDLSKLGCPRVQGINKDLDKIYLFSRCGGTTVMSYNTSITSYDFDGENYLIYQKAELFNNATNSLEESYRLLWKFDKDLKFVSTENV